MDLTEKPTSFYFGKMMDCLDEHGIEKTFKILNSAMHEIAKSNLKTFMEDPGADIDYNEIAFDYETWRVQLVKAIANAKKPEYKATIILV